MLLMLLRGSRCSLMSVFRRRWGRRAPKKQDGCRDTRLSHSFAQVRRFMTESGLVYGWSWELELGIATANATATADDTYIRTLSLRTILIPPWPDL
jgi:hypothetical protein